MEFLYTELNPLLAEGVFSISGEGAPPVLQPVAINCTAPFAMYLASRLTAPYEDRKVIKASVVSPFGVMFQNAASTEVPYNILSNAAARCRTGFDVLTHDPIACSNIHRYTIASDSIQSVAGLPLLLVNGNELRVIDAEISCDESSPFWICTIGMASVSDYALISVGDSIALEIGGLVIEFIVDGKTFQRSVTDSGVDEVPKISGSSPLALLDSPFSDSKSVTYSVDTSARQVVEDQIGSCEWNMPDWIIPAFALIFTDATPLGIAQQVVESVGGLIESDVDGTPICRMKHPVSVPDYATADVAFSLLDTSIMEVSESISPSAGYNRVTISNDTSLVSSGVADSLDQLDVDGDASQRIIRAYLVPVRKVTLVHSGNQATTVNGLGLQSRTESERIEFKDGAARTQYKIASIVSKSWRGEDLGELSISGYDLTSTTPSYSLLDIIYTVETVNFLVQCPNIDEVQFYLVDA